MDLLFLSLPWVGVVIGILFGLGRDIHAPGMIFEGANTVARWALVPLLGGIGWLIRLAFSYGNQWRQSTVVDLVGELEVSHIRCIPVELEGKVIGRGVPGLFWSKDLVLQDESGFITLIYRQPLSILDTLFGMFKAERLIGSKGKFRGWYRRGPIPYVELSSAHFEYGDNIKCYYPTWLWVAAWLVTIIGALMFFARV
jgi:heat shock protein HtpX